METQVRSKERRPAEAECQFVIVCDTREQLSYKFQDLRSDAKDGNRPISVRITRGTLHQGDYSLLGFETQIAIERKSLEDLFSTLGPGRHRFHRELERLAAMPHAEVIVEAEWSVVLADPPERSRLPPKTVFRSVIAWRERFPTVGWWFVPSRRMGEIVTFRRLERFWKSQGRKSQGKSQGLAQ